MNDRELVFLILPYVEFIIKEEKRREEKEREKEKGNILSNLL